MKIPKYLFILILHFLFMAEVNASPDSSNWYKLDLIGSNNTSVFYYLTHEELPGSHYLSFTHYYLMSQNINTGVKDIKVLLKTTKNTLVENGDEFVNKHEDTFVSDENPMHIINSNNVRFIFPDFDAKMNYRFDKKGMYILNEGKRITILTEDVLKKWIPEYEAWYDWEDGIKVIQVYSNKQYYFYILQYGVGGDIDFFQSILPVKKDIVIKNKMHERKKYKK